LLRQQDLRSEKVSTRTICERDEAVCTFRPEIVPFRPRSPRQQSITEQARD